MVYEHSIKGLDMPPIPDWQLPAGVDRGLWDYMNSQEMVVNYDAAMAISPLAEADQRFCEKVFQKPGRLIDLGCGTGRLTHQLARRGFDCLGVDLSNEMLASAKQETSPASFQQANLTDLSMLESQSFDYAACLFSTLGMIIGEENRKKALQEMARILKPDGLFVLHVHNRYYLQGLGLKGFRNGDVTMPQAYGGAPLTLHHYSKSEIVKELESCNLKISQVKPLGIQKGGDLNCPWLFPSLRSYGYLIAGGK
jgi:ubiquinone/menaquinone biosynthesis C-methylase UbiE